MEKLKYNIDDFPFREMIRDWFKVDLDRLHEEKNYKHFTRKTDQQTHWHKLFYEKVRESNEWDWHYKWFIKQIKKVSWNDKPIVYQKIPTFRVHFPDNVAVGEWHKDIEYRSEDWVDELNYYVPVTEAKDTSTLYVETECGNTPLDTEYGEYWEWNGLKMKHGNVENITGKTRVSFDFRVHLYQDHYLVDKTAMSINTKVPFTIGGYYEVMDKLGDEREGETITWS